MGPEVVPDAPQKAWHLIPSRNVADFPKGTIIQEDDKIRKNAATSGLDTKQPRSFIHLKVNLKHLQNEEERQASIDYENRILLAKMTNILRSNGQLDNWNYDFEQHSKSLNRRNLTKERDRLHHENQILLARVRNSRSTYDADMWNILDDRECWPVLSVISNGTYGMFRNLETEEDDFLMHKYYLDLKKSSSKHQERGVGCAAMDKQPFIFYSADQPKGKQDNVETTIMPKKKRRILRLPVLGTERKKQTAKKKRDAALKVPTYDMKDEAVKLFKATKGMGKPQSIVINTLCRRTQTQRQLTKAKFEEQFGLSLGEELSAQLDDDYCLLVGALLAKKPEYDAESMHRALKGDGPFVETLVEILCTKSNKDLCAMKEAYSSKYAVSLEADIKSEVKGQLRHLLHTLIKGTRSDATDVDVEAPRKNAAKLKAARDSERWNVDKGVLSELVKTGGWDCLVSVLHEYETMIGNPVLGEFENFLFADYKDAIVSLVKCLRDCPKFLAEQLHENLQPDGDELTVMRIIIMRSEVDMALIRKSYKKMYGEPLIDIIRKSLPMTCKGALASMVSVHGRPKKNMPENHEQKS